jgi:hypothetical protein
MSKEVPIGPEGPNRSHFRQLSAGSVEGAAGERRFGYPGSNVFNGDDKPQASAQSASLSGLERAVASTSESARTLDKVRAALEEVCLANQAAAQAQVPDVDEAAQAAQELLDQQGRSECGKGKTHRSTGSAKTWQGLLG